MNDSLHSAPPADDLELETRLVHAGTLRSDFGETSEALFLTQGHVYESAEQCEARFKGEDPGYIYARFSNPTVGMFEDRMAALEGAEAARATATGMAAVTASLLGQLRAGDHVVAARALFGSCRFVVEELLPRFGVASTLVDGTRPRRVARGGAARDQGVLPREPDEPDARGHRHRRRRRASPTPPARSSSSTTSSRRRSGRARSSSAPTVVVYSATKHIDGQGRCLGGVDPRLEGVHRDEHPRLSAPDRPGAVARSTPGCC